MNTAVANVLNRVLGDWVKDLNADQLSLSVFKGEVCLEHLHLKENILHVLGLPFDLRHGSIGRIKVSIPWTSLLSSSLSIEISDVYAYLTPKSPSSWSEKFELAALETAKESAIKQFEAFTDNEIKESGSSGYLISQATTIVNNVQVKINNIYIRYEDTISSSDAFAVGLSLKSLSIQTCNNNWAPEYVSNCDICYKLIKIEGFQMFCDYNVKIIKFQDYFKGPLDKEFPHLAQQDIKEEILHNYILKPFSFDLKVTFATKPSYDIPLADISFISNALFFEVHSGQIKLMFKFAEFMKMYNNFKTGVLRNLAEHDFINEEEAMRYKEEYQYWKNCTTGDEEKKASEIELKKMHERINLECIIRVRDETNKELRHRKTVDLKLQEIEAIKNESPGLVSRFSGVFRRESVEETNKREQEKQRRIEIANEELKLIMKNAPNTQNTPINNPVLMLDWQKYRFFFSIIRGGINLCHGPPLITSRFEKFAIDGFMTEKNLKTRVQISAFYIREHTGNDSVYPYLFKSEEFCFDYNQCPMDIKITSGDAFLCVKYAEVMKVVKIFTDAASATVDVSEYVHQAGFKINNYIADGENYFTGVITQGASSSSLTLDIQMNAPKIVIPSDSTSKSPYLLINLGKLACTTSSIGNYEIYNIKLSELESYAVWKWEDIGKVQNSNKDYFINPVEIALILKKATKNDYIIPGFDIDLNMSAVDISINEKIIELFIKISNQFKIEKSPVKAKAVKNTKTPEKLFALKPLSPSQQGSLLLPRSPSVIASTPSAKLSNEKFDFDKPKIKEKRGSIRALEEVDQIVPIKAKIKFCRLRIDVNEGDRPLAQVKVMETGFLIDLDCKGNIRGKVSVLIFEVSDMREFAPFKKVLGSPNDEEMKDESDYQLFLDIDIKPKEHLSDLAIIMNDFRFTASKDFASALMTFYSTHSGKFRSPSPKMFKSIPLPKYFIRYTSNSRYTLNLKSLEIWLPTSESNLKVAQFNMTLTLTYRSSIDISYTYSDQNLELSRKYYKCEEDAYLTISHFGGYLLRFKKGNIGCKNKNLISPCRLSVEYYFNKSAGNICADMNVYVRIESICMLIGFKDLEFFRTLGDNWTSLPKMTQEKIPDAKGQEDITKINVNVDGDAVQITLIDDAGKNSVSMLHMQISNMLVMMKQDSFSMSVRSEIIMFIDYFNKMTGAWEPALEDWKFIAKYSISYEHNHSQIILKSNNIFNCNLTQNLIENLAIISTKISNPKHHQESEDQGNEATQHGGLVYEIQNQIGLELTAWIRIAQNTEKWYVNDDPKSFTQGYVNRLHALSRKKAKSSSALNNIQAPTKLAFYFREKKKDGEENDTFDMNSLQNNEVANEVIIEIVGFHMFKIQTEKCSFPCLVENYVQGGKRIICFKPGVIISNNSQVEVLLTRTEKKLMIFPLTYQSLPLDWILDLNNIIIEGKKSPISNEKLSKTNTLSSNLNEKPFLTEQSELIISNNPISCTSIFYKLNSDTNLQVIELNPPFFIRNLLHSIIEIYDSDNWNIETISPGEEKIVNIKPEVKYYMKLILLEGLDNGGNKVMLTEPMFLFNKKPSKCRIQGHIKSSIIISSEEKIFESHKNLATYAESPKKSSGSSWVIKIYSEYVIVNKTQYDLVLSGLEIPINENCYYSSSNNKAQLKMKAFNSKYSDKFALDTIGVSGVVKISQVQNATPKYFLFGVNISQAPKPLILSKIVTFVPRFMIWNYLDIPLCIKQYGIERAKEVNVKENSSKEFSLQYHFDDYSVSRGIVVADALHLNEIRDNTWSAPFDLEVIEDLQIKFFSKETQAEKKQNVFKKGFYVPTTINPNRYIRVFIYSQDEATIHIAFLDPKDPDFKIINELDEPIYVKQKKAKTEPYQINKESSMYWVWENNLLKDKMIEVTVGKNTVYMSLEKVKEDKPVKFKNYEALLTVKGVTRELIVRHFTKKDSKILEEQKSSKEPSIAMLIPTIENEESVEILNSSKFAKTNIFSPSKPSILKKSSLSLESPLKSVKPENASNAFNLFKVEEKITSSDIRILLSEIGISTNDESNNELFYINFKNLKIRHLTKALTDSSNRKVTTQSSVRLEHLQIDYMGSNDKLIPVIVYPVRHENEVAETSKDKILTTIETTMFDTTDVYFQDDEGYKFFSLELSREFSSRLKRDGTVLASMDKFDNIEILLREVQFRINEETIHNLLKVKNFFAAFSNHQNVQEVNMSHSVFSGELPKIPFEPFTFQRKAYFNKVIIHAMKLFLTFKKSGSDLHAENDYDVEFPLIGFIKKLGGEFVNVSESPMSFTKVFIEHAFQTLDSFTWILIKKYMQQGIRQFYKIFGSIDILGNPLGLIDNLGTGVYEFISAPAKGLVSSTSGSFVKGLSTGVKSLISGVVGGSFGSISKISGSLYNVLRTATGEKVIYQEISTDNIGKNMVIGFKDSLMDVANGVGGIVIKPYKGAKAEGTKGFFKGFLTGTFSLISSPFKLVLKVSNVISTTIASTSILITKGKIQKYGRTRFPRQLGIRNILEQYNKELAEAQALLKTFITDQKYKDEKLVFYAQTKLDKDDKILEDKNVILMITSTKLWVVIDGELAEHVKIDSILFLEFHCVKKIYFLGVASEKKNFSVPSKEYCKLNFVYNVILCLNDKLPNKKYHSFACPDYVSKTAL
ncbi:hypothetical protein SteCoe_10520 [Stentor coeruleus]|uniref:Uncharacterized protein n=1 Tax=Stentor coeruleus TaxID=5963 RepID=A0A1R2CF72_9CILI|nr:hypothetical protein SteCoe_10520 [Stentor coeruleus]